MKKLAIDLTEQEQEIFSKAFYQIADKRVEDTDTPCPWGCPWYYNESAILEGKTVEDMAENFWNEFRNEIRRILDEEACYSENMND